MIKKKWEQIQNSRFFRWIKIPAFILVVFLQYLEVEWSYLGLAEIANIPMKYKLAAVAVLLAVTAVLLLICKNLRLTMNISVGLTTLLALTNYYVNAFRGTPFAFYLLQNLVAAANVVGAYSFTITARVAILLASAVLHFLMVNLIFAKTAVKRKVSAVAVACLGLMMYIFYLAPTPLVPRGIVGWSWIHAARTYGYIPSLLRSEATKVEAPEGYDPDALSAQMEAYTVQNQGGDTPDLIFILNEAFFNLEQVTDVQASTDPLAYIHSLENTLQGYCVVQGVGGGTNISEYEYLSSNSLYLTPNINPFVTMDIAQSNSVVSHLESLGYSTLGAHSETGANYERASAYPALGFDQYYFDEDFLNRTYYGERECELDESLYENLFRWYEEMGEGPRALYLLTMQNHGPYRDLEADQYLVCTGRDYGDLTQEVNEYLTCMQLTDQAFQKLVEYYSNVERDVVICMVGDHAPYFIADVADGSYSEQQMQLQLRGVPYVIWSNNLDLSQVQMPEWTSLPFMVPLTLRAAGVELSAYYDYMAELSESVPVLTDYGSYVTADGEIYTYDQQNQYTEQIQRYFYMDYANMVKEPFMNG